MNPDSPDSVFEITGILDVKSVAVLLLSRMKNGVFEGANKPDFSDAQIIHNIAKIPAPDYNTVVLKQPARYRYVRYRTPPMGFCNVAEIEFYSPAGKRLAGKNIGTAGAISGAPEMTCDKAFDGKVGTYFECREEDKSTAWTGLDLLTETAIGTIRYCPRIDPVGAKPIVKGHVYEAFYFTSGGWTSLGKTTADSNRLRLKILRQSLFYLRDHTDAVNGKQMSAGGF
jgi:hypothetical protein